MGKTAKRVLIFACIIINMTSVQGRSIQELWIDMPDSIAHYLNKDMRKKMIDVAMIGANKTVENLFEEPSSIDSIADGYLSVSMSASLKLELKTTINEKGDSCIVMLSTFCGDKLRETTINVYDFKWNRLFTHNLSPNLCLDESSDNVADDDNPILVSIAATFDGDDGLMLVPYYFHNSQKVKYKQRNIKLSDIIFK